VAVVRYCDEFDAGLGWIVDDEFLERCSHALVAEGRVWLIDPVDGDGVVARVRALGEPGGVIQLLDRHARDSAALAESLGVPHHDVPFGGVPGAPFRFLRVQQSRFWREVALWWPERRVLVVGDALGTARYFRARAEPLAVHALLRLRPPRALRGLDPEHLLVGHGEGVHGPDAAVALREALATSRRRIPSVLATFARGRLRHRSRR
jgi:hypothetical protein